MQPWEKQMMVVSSGCTFLNVSYHTSHQTLEGRQESQESHCGRGTKFHLDPAYPSSPRNKSLIHWGNEGKKNLSCTYRKGT